MNQERLAGDFTRLAPGLWPGRQVDPYTRGPVSLPPFIFRWLSLLILCGWGAAEVAVAQGVRRELITLDPICHPANEDAPVLAPGNPAAGTRRMIARLKELRENAELASLKFESDRLVPLVRAQLEAETDPRRRMKWMLQLAQHQVEAGRPDSGLNTLADMDEAMAASGVGVSPMGRMDLRMRRAAAFLRLGEQENCLAQHNPESCLFPLSPRAVHQLPRGSRTAIAIYEEHLQELPGDLGARWLMNIAYMTLGGYPDRVPPQFLIPPKVFASDHIMPRFPDIAGALHVDVHGQAGGVIADDFDNDGFIDLMVSAWSLSGQLRYFHNNGDGTFTERTSEAGLVGLTGGLNIQQTDYNNDGWLDVWLMRGAWLGTAGRQPRSLLRNNGDGTFTDVTDEVGLLTQHPTQSSRWFDYDGDGWLDLFVGNESTDARDPDWCELFHNNRNGTFTEVAASSGIRVAALVKGVACADYDNDGRPDLYLSVRNGPNILLHNDGPAPGGTNWMFSDVTAKARVAEPVMSFPTWFFDFDNDGFEDLFCSGYWLTNGVADIAADYLGQPGGGARAKMYRNNGDGTFTDVTVKLRLDRVLHTMGCNFGDLDNDGWLDFYLGTGDPAVTTLVPHRMFRNAGGEFFQDVTTATGTGHLQKGHAVAFADFDNDGDQDVFEVVGGAYTGDTARCALFLNPGTTNHWLKLKLVGTKANRPAIGARLDVTLQTPSGPRHLFRTVGSGGSFGSNPLRQEIGLGDAMSVTDVEIRWPGTGLVQKVTGLERDQAYEIREGTANAAPLNLKRLRFADGTTPAGSGQPRASAGP